MTSQRASQKMSAAMVSIFATMRSGWVPRLTGAAAAMVAVMLLGIATGTVSVPAQQPQQPPQISDTSLAPGGSFLLTIFLKHDESKTLDQINAQAAPRRLLDRAIYAIGEDAHAKALAR